MKTQAGNPGNRRVAQPSLFGSGLGFRQCGCLTLARCLSSFTVWESATKTRNGKTLGTRPSQFDPTTAHYRSRTEENPCLEFVGPWRLGDTPTFQYV